MFLDPCAKEPSSEDIFRVALVNIDNQNDFVKTDGAMPVPGADAAANRAAHFIDVNHERITTIFSSLDKHLLNHIFYATWWKDAHGNHPNDFTTITFDSVLRGTWIPQYEKDWSINYVKTLRSFTIWPVHCTANTSDSEIVSILSVAIGTHSILRNSKHIHIEKGQNDRTEYCGIFCAEVEDPLDPKTKLNIRRIKQIADYNRTYWFGQEENHCVRRTLEQYIAWCELHNPEAISRMRYLEDCICLLDLGSNYKRDAQASIDSMIKKGILLVSSTDPIV